LENCFTFALTKDKSERFLSKRLTIARVAQLVEHDLAKVGVASSNLVSRSKRPLKKGFVVFRKFKSLITLENAGMVEQVDTQDLKSCESNLVRVRFPLLVQASLSAGLFFYIFFP
jgi:hypothetical protein